MRDYFERGICIDHGKRIDSGSAPSIARMNSMANMPRTIRMPAISFFRLFSISYLVISSITAGIISHG